MGGLDLTCYHPKQHALSCKEFLKCCSNLKAWSCHQGKAKRKYFEPGRVWALCKFLYARDCQRNPFLLSLLSEILYQRPRLRTNTCILSTMAKYLQCFCCLAVKLMVLGPFPARPCIVLGQQTHSPAPFRA